MRSASERQSRSTCHGYGASWFWLAVVVALLSGVLNVSGCAWARRQAAEVGYQVYERAREDLFRQLRARLSGPAAHHAEQLVNGLLDGVQRLLGPTAAEAVARGFAAQLDSLVAVVEAKVQQDDGGISLELWQLALAILGPVAAAAKSGQVVERRRQNGHGTKPVAP